MMLVLSALLACSATPSDTSAGGPGDTDKPTADPDAEAPDLVINEFMAVNQSTIKDEGGSWSDWVELYNPGPDTVSFAGLYLTDEDDEPTQWALPQGGTLEPGGYAIFWADANTGEGDHHTAFKLSGSGEFIGLYFAAEGRAVEQIDVVEFGAQSADVSEARVPDGSVSWVKASTPTPGATNGG